MTLHAVLAERYPSLAEMQDELQRAVPPTPFRKGAKGMLRLEELLLHARAGRR
jgi:hypothetical protein